MDCRKSEAPQARHNRLTGISTTSNIDNGVPDHAYAFA
jgi:hypothetical protein